MTEEAWSDVSKLEVAHEALKEELVLAKKRNLVLQDQIKVLHDAHMALLGHLLPYDKHGNMNVAITIINDALDKFEVGL